MNKQPATNTSRTRKQPAPVVRIGRRGSTHGEPRRIVHAFSLDPRLLERIRAVATDQGMTLSAWVEGSLNAALDEVERKQATEGAQGGKA
jgi:hypothetical protein